MRGLSDGEIEVILGRANAATPGPWYWRAGTHTTSRKTSDAGGLHTRAPVHRVLPDGREIDDETVAFPVGKIGGDPYWLERFQRAVSETAASNAPAPLSVAFEIFARDEDKAFIAHAREDIPAVVHALQDARAELARLRAALR